MELRSRDEQRSSIDFLRQSLLIDNSKGEFTSLYIDEVRHSRVEKNSGKLQNKLKRLKSKVFLLVPPNLYGNEMSIIIIMKKTEKQKPGFSPFVARAKNYRKLFNINISFLNNPSNYM